MAGRSSRVKMRSRPIDVNKSLLIADTTMREPDDVEIEMAQALLPGGGGAPGGGHGHGGHGHSGHTGQGDGTVSGVGIPTPPIHIDTDYHRRFDYGTFVQPSYYIKAHQTAGTGLVNQLDRYDLLLEDLEWLAAYNAAAEAKRPPGPTMSEDDMERLIDLFEKEAGKITLSGMRAEMMNAEDKIDPRKEFPLVRAIVVAATTLHVRTKILEPVYEYWIDKRKRLGKALMRQFQEAPPRGNTDPHVAFRLRTEGRRISKRNPRKDDTSGYQKMHYLKRDFLKILDIVDNVQTREQLKRESALLNIHIFDALLQQSPWAVKAMQPYPEVQSAIATLNAIPPPASSAAGAPIPTLPAVLASAPPASQRLFHLLHSMHPACSYNRAELDAETRRKKALRSAAGLAAITPSHKRPSQVMTQQQQQQQQRPVDRHKTSSGSHHGSSEQRAREKEMRKAARQREHDRAAAAGGVGGLSTVEEEMEEMELTDEEDFLSEDEQDARFYAQVEAHVKRMRIMAPEATAPPAAAAPASTSGKLDFAASLAASGVSLPFYPFPPPSSHIPPGGKVGAVRGVVGRGNLLWLECLIDPHPPHQQQLLLMQQQQQHQLAQQQQQMAIMQQQQQQAQAAAAAAAAAAASASAMPASSSSSLPLASSSSSSSGASSSRSLPVPMDTQQSRQMQPQAIRAQ